MKDFTITRERRLALSAVVGFGLTACSSGGSDTQDPGANYVGGMDYGEHDIVVTGCFRELDYLMTGSLTCAGRPDLRTPYHVLEVEHNELPQRIQDERDVVVEVSGDITYNEGGEDHSSLRREEVIFYDTLDEAVKHFLNDPRVEYEKRPSGFEQGIQDLVATITLVDYDAIERWSSGDGRHDVVTATITLADRRFDAFILSKDTIEIVIDTPRLFYGRATEDEVRIDLGHNPPDFLTVIRGDWDEKHVTLFVNHAEIGPDEGNEIYNFHIQMHTLQFAESPPSVEPVTIYVDVA